ncbi:hypothetical protein PHET_02289 [Paragonimus heterotremus]|uniref:Uncharacterized protein n=1 Tax=Paragonimus heterotremus TaxID=100268 RepID=A0A8J4TKB4_9TREM|nr:hypothetical protein PHET_02289 [Paragonimus heterotremus]
MKSNSLPYRTCNEEKAIRSPLFVRFNNVFHPRSGLVTINPIVTSTLLFLAASDALAWSILEIEIHHVQLTHRLCMKQMLCDLQVTYTLLSQPGTEQKVEFTLENVTYWREERQVRRGDGQLKHKQTFRRKFLSNDWDQITLQTTLRLTAPSRRHSPMNIQTSVSRILALAPHAIVAPYHELQLTGSGVDSAASTLMNCPSFSISFMHDDFGEMKPHQVQFDEDSAPMDFVLFIADFLFTYAVTARKDIMEDNVKIRVLLHRASTRNIYGVTNRQSTVVKAEMKIEVTVHLENPILTGLMTNYTLHLLKAAKLTTAGGLTFWQVIRREQLNHKECFDRVLSNRRRMNQVSLLWCVEERSVTLASESNELTQACEKWRESPKLRVQGMWRFTADLPGTTPTVEANRPEMVTMWREFSHVQYTSSTTL